jgi:hypothetical protein
LEAKPYLNSCVVIGNLAGCISKNCPYPKIKLHGILYSQHRIILLLHHKYCPEIVEVIDKTLADEGAYNILIENLQETTRSRFRYIRNTIVGKTSKY